jgi:hypothetical protein
MKKLHKFDIITLVIFVISTLIASVLLGLSGIKTDTNTSGDNKINDTLFWIGIPFAIISATSMIIFLIRTGIDLSLPTITNTKIDGVQQINPGVSLF